MSPRDKDLVLPICGGLRVSLRLPDGTRIVRDIPMDSDRLGRHAQLTMMAWAETKAAEDDARPREFSHFTKGASHG